jgi:hypothetical protein
MASEIVVAAIGGGAGLATGVVGSLFAPWANWGVEQRRLRQQRRVERIAEWRRGVEDLRQAEDNYLPPRTVVVGDTRTEDEVHSNRSLFDVTIKDWFVTLKPELTHSAKGMVEQLAKQPLDQRKGLVPKLLADEITRIEQQKWKLI